MFTQQGIYHLHLIRHLPSPSCHPSPIWSIFFFLCSLRDTCTTFFYWKLCNMKLENQYSVTVSTVNLVKIFEASFILNYFIKSYLLFKSFCLDATIEGRQIFLKILYVLNSFYMLFLQEFFTFNSFIKIWNISCYMDNFL